MTTTPSKDWPTEAPAGFLDFAHPQADGSAIVRITTVEGDTLSIRIEADMLLLMAEAMSEAFSNPSKTKD